MSALIYLGSFFRSIVESLGFNFSQTRWFVGVLVEPLLFPQNPHGHQYIALLIARSVIIHILFAQFDIRRSISCISRILFHIQFHSKTSPIHRKAHHQLHNVNAKATLPQSHQTLGNRIQNATNCSSLFFFFFCDSVFTTIICSTFKINQIATEMRRSKSEKNKTEWTIARRF